MFVQGGTITFAGDFDITHGAGFFGIIIDKSLTIDGVGLRRFHHRRRK